MTMAKIIFSIGIRFSINILFVSTSSSDNESGTESKGKSPILSRKKIRHDSCSSGALVNGAMPDSVAASWTKTWVILLLLLIYYVLLPL